MKNFYLERIVGKITLKLMKQLAYFLSILFLFSSNLFAQEDNDYEYMNAYVVVADTSANYYLLRNKMINLSNELQIEIDTMGRTYNKEQNLILFPDSEDVNNGFFPRRYPTNTLSLEHFNFYTNKQVKSDLIALIVSISENKEEAANYLLKTKKLFPNAFIIESSIYMGCMH